MSSPPRIAIPMPHSGNREYAERSIPQYERAVALAGGEPVRVALDLSIDDIKKIAGSCDAELLPGSGADVDPAKYKAERSLRTTAPDLHREPANKLLLQDHYSIRKPIL